ncbi:hypothetical protein CRH09_31360 [Nocardia terpenica]|uniref:Serine hydrolase n=2 Tax=Nocardia terpenica TaxID=455432 RepID=A0A291RRP9_9NOCA|nr:hypothetical protein CRH09_31360 [Nocardia terpenica]
MAKVHVVHAQATPASATDAPPSLAVMPAAPPPQVEIPFGPTLKQAAPPRLSATDLAQQMVSAIDAASPGTRVGIDVVDTNTGAVLASVDADQQFYTASVVKLLIGIDAFEGQGWQPDSLTTDQVQRMLSASDDDIADELWDVNGGNAIVDRMIARIGLTGTQPPDDPSQWGETLTTAQDVVAVYRYLTTSVPQPARDLIVNALVDVTPVAADGTDQYFGIPDALPTAGWAVKPGWMSLDSSTTLDTTGLVGANAAAPLHYAVVVLSAQPAGVDWGTGGAALTAGVAVLRGRLTA